MGRYFIANAMGDSVDSPTRDEMSRFLAQIDVTDEEHAAAWLSTDEGWSLEWNGDGRLVLSSPDHDLRHLAEVSRDRAVELWTMLAERRVDTLLAERWQAGNGFVLTTEHAERIRTAVEHADREFYAVLGEERSDVRCQTAGCTRGAITLSVLCRPHHFEMVRRRPCPCSD